MISNANTIAKIYWMHVRAKLAMHPIFFPV